MRRIRPKLLPTLAIIAILGAPMTASAAKIVTVPFSPAILQISSIKVSGSTYNVKVTFSLGTSNGGASIASTVITASTKTCTALKTAKNCTIKSVKKGVLLLISAKSKNLKGFSVSSTKVRFVVGGTWSKTSISTPSSGNYGSSAPSTSDTSGSTPQVQASGCTITGTSGDDVLEGTSGNDVICGKGGKDKIRAKAGKDIIYATLLQSASGKAVSAAGVRKLADDAEDTGADDIDGGEGDDIIYGGSGNDVMTGGEGNDQIYGGAGNDVIGAGDGANSVTAGDGDDAITSGSGVDTVNAGAGDDSVESGAGNDTVDGGAGDDGLIGGEGADTLRGADGTPAAGERNLCESDGLDTVTFCGFDTAAPYIRSASFVGGSTIDTSSGPVTKTVRMHVTDELMGTSSVGCAVLFLNARTTALWNSAQKVSGTNRDGWWECDLIFVTGMQQGLYGLSVSTRDSSGANGFADQSRSMSGDDYKGHSNLPEIMDQTPSHWITQAGIGDARSARITNVRWDKSVITAADSSTSDADRTVIVTFHLSDDLSGVNWAQCGLIHPNVYDVFAWATFVSGTIKEGEWSCSLVLPKDAGTGKWGLRIGTSDNVGKQYSIGADMLTTNVWNVDDVESPTTVPDISGIGLNSFTQSGPGDDDKPLLTSVSMSRTSIDTSSSSQSVTVTLTVNEVLSGINLTWPLPEIRFFSSTNAQNVGSCSASRTGATTTLTCVVVFPLGTAPGNQMMSIMMTDNALNRSEYYSYVADTSDVSNPIAEGWRQRVIYGDVYDATVVGPWKVINERAT